MPDTTEAELPAPSYSAKPHASKRAVIIKAMATFRGAGYFLGMDTIKDGTTIRCALRIDVPRTAHLTGQIRRRPLNRTVEVPPGVTRVIVTNPQQQVIASFEF
jgi:hypothetical protein